MNCFSPVLGKNAPERVIFSEFVGGIYPTPGKGDRGCALSKASFDGLLGQEETPVPL
jgi:hypothetical protein